VPPAFILESEPWRDWFILPEFDMGWFCWEIFEGEFLRIPKASWTDLSFSMFISDGEFCLIPVQGLGCCSTPAGEMGLSLDPDPLQGSSFSFGMSTPI